MSRLPNVVSAIDLCPRRAAHTLKAAYRTADNVQACAGVTPFELAPAGMVAVVSAGTSDAPVAAEAALTTRAFGAGVRVVNDVGVAGLHRVMAVRDQLASADCLVVVAGMEGQIRDITRSILAEAAERRDVEMVHEVVGSLPTQVIGRLFGLPEADWDMLHALAERNTSGQDPDINPDGDNTEAGDADSSMQMALYGMQFAASRREMEPQGDLMDIILGQQFAGRYLTDADVGSMLVQMITAGNDTTVTMIVGGIWLLMLRRGRVTAPAPRAA